MFIGVQNQQYKLSFLHATHLLDLIYDPTKNYQVISNSMGDGRHKISASGEISA